MGGERGALIRCCCFRISVYTQTVIVISTLRVCGECAIGRAGRPTAYISNYMPARIYYISWICRCVPYRVHLVFAEFSRGEMTSELSAPDTQMRAQTIFLFFSFHSLQRELWVWWHVFFLVFFIAERFTRTEPVEFNASGGSSISQTTIDSNWFGTIVCPATRRWKWRTTSANGRRGSRNRSEIERRQTEFHNKVRFRCSTHEPYEFRLISLNDFHRLARAGPRSEQTTYETVNFNGSFRRADAAPRGVRNSNYPPGLQMLRRPRCGRDESIPLHSIGSNDIVSHFGNLECVEQITSYFRLFSGAHTGADCDGECGETAGGLWSSIWSQQIWIQNTSFDRWPHRAMRSTDIARGRLHGRRGVQFIPIHVYASRRCAMGDGCIEAKWVTTNHDDNEFVYLIPPLISLPVYDCNSTYGESCYRLMARTGEFIYLRTRGYLDIDRDSNQVRSFVCHNALVDEEEGKRLVREMKKKFAIMIQETDFSANEADVPAVENPVQLERAILSLITNLHNTPSSSVDDMVPSPAETHYSTDGHESDTNRSAKSPPLSLIPPKPSTIKTSISKSVNIVVSASKGILNYKSNTSSTTTTTTTATTSSDLNADGHGETTTCITSMKFSRPSVVQRAKSGTKPMESSVTSTASKASSSPRRSDPFVSGMVKIKEEHPDTELRVPPLPTSVGYFEMDACYDPPSQYMESVSSPLECKPFDLLAFSQQQTQANDFLSSPGGDGAQSPYQSEYDQSGGIGMASPSYSEASTRPQSGLKRTRSIEESDGVHKRRLYSNSSSTTIDDSSDQFDIKPSLSLHESCIDQLTDPDLSEFGFVKF